MSLYRISNEDLNSQIHQKVERYHHKKIHESKFTATPLKPLPVIDENDELSIQKKEESISVKSKSEYFLSQQHDIRSSSGVYKLGVRGNINKRDLKRDKQSLKAPSVFKFLITKEGNWNETIIKNKRILYTEVYIYWTLLVPFLSLVSISINSEYLQFLPLVIIAVF